MARLDTIEQPTYSLILTQRELNLLATLLHGVNTLPPSGYVHYINEREVEGLKREVYPRVNSVHYTESNFFRGKLTYIKEVGD